MADQDFIPRRAALEPSQDYALLRSAGLRHVEELAHARWTDYNGSFPSNICFMISS